MQAHTSPPDDAPESGVRPVAARLPALDGLRGIASLIVVIAHSYNSLTLPLEAREQISHSPLALLLSSTGAVQLFFVLSGYVLAGSLARSHGATGTAQYLVRRVFRIHPPYLAALGFAWLASFFYVATPPEHAQGLSHLVMQVQLTGTDLLKACMFPGRARGQLPVGWTLRVEMLFSLALPLMVWVARRGHWSLLIIGSVATLFYVEQTDPFGYVIDFSLGIAAYMERDRLTAFMTALPQPLKIAWIAASITIFTAPMAFWSQPMMGIYFVSPSPLHVTVLGVGSVGLVIGATTLPMLARPLEWRVVQYLGRISFSLYLVHFTLIMLFTQFVERPTTWPSALLFIAVIIGSSTLLSDLAYRFVERPSIELGNRVSSRIGGTR